jgi:Lecithin retinol acyltransferase
MPNPMIAIPRSADTRDLLVQRARKRLLQLIQEWAPRDRVLSDGEEPPIAAHLVSPRGMYSHHGIYTGRSRVIHYSGLSSGFRSGPVEEVSLKAFSRGRAVRVRSERILSERSEVVRRARTRLGENQYRLFSNNCKHFCTWCICGPTREGGSRGQKRVSIYKTMAVPVARVIERICNSVLRPLSPFPPRDSTSFSQASR